MLKSFDTIDLAWKYALKDVLDFGDPVKSRNGGSKEIVGYAFRVLNPRARVLTNERRKMSRFYAAAETLWYLSRESHVARLVAYAPQYQRFAGSRGHANGAYGSRWRYNGHEDAIIAAYNVLRTQENSRQAVVAMWAPWDLETAFNKSSPDIPCTLSMQFLLRDGMLHLQVNMRSNDLWLGTPYDCFAFMTLQHLMADSLGVGLGTYVHSVGSMHIYDKDIEKAVAAERANHNKDAVLHGSLPPTVAICALEDGGRWAMQERQMRVAHEPFLQEPGSYMDDMVVACQNKLMEGQKSVYHSQCMEEQS